MWLYLHFLLAGCFCRSASGVLTVSALQGSVATLSCPYVMGDVTWSRHTLSGELTLVTIKNGAMTTTDERFTSTSKNSLVIKNVTLSDTTMYLCNGKRVYLNVTTDPHSAGNVPVTRRNHGQGFDQKVIAADEGSQRPSDVWKVVVGVVVGAALVLFVIVVLRLYSKNTTQKNDNASKSEVIYEEIEPQQEPPDRESYFESPYYWTSINETPNTSTPSNNSLYRSVNKLRAKGCSGEECVYSLAQNPLQTGSAGQ